ncbi:MAG: GNAT family N-acetyltransferase [Burkholderiaceae bacterium]|nr:GNAT family N-acetyltransferase [Burkholderiaceae bacterium]
MKAGSGLAPAFSARLLSRIEDAGLNASAPPQQRWLDGWLVRFSPGKAKRARCINALAPGRLPLDEKLALAARVLTEAGLPMLVRITPFSEPGQLDALLEARRWPRIDDTRVMALAALDGVEPEALPAGLVWQPMALQAFAQAVGQLRGSPLAQSQAHAERLALSPVPFRALAIRSQADGALWACGQFAREADLVGLYDIFTAEFARGQGLARRLCSRLLLDARSEGARCAYLQVEGHNQAARSVYRRLGFADGYAYHYRTANRP